MKRGTIEHPKTLNLAEILGSPIFVAVGILECLWHWTSKYAPAGDIGKWTNVRIAQGVFWPDDDADRLVDALIKSGYVDAHPKRRLVVHDWIEHCDDSTHMFLARKTERFFDGSIPRLTRIEKGERDSIQKSYHFKDKQLNGSQNPCAQKAHPKRIQSAQKALPKRTALPSPPLPSPALPCLADSPPYPPRDGTESESESEKKSASSHLTKQQRGKNRKREPSSAGAVAAAVVSNTAPFELEQFRARTVSDTADEIVTLTGEPHWREWWVAVGGTLFDSGDGWAVLCEHVDKLRVAADPEQRRAKDMGEFEKPGAYLVSRVVAWMKEKKLRWPGFPERVNL